MEFWKGIIILATSTCLGCSIVPEVQYKIINSGADMKDQADSFYPQQTTIAVKFMNETRNPGGDEKEIIQTEYEASASQSEYRKTKIGIKPISSWRSKTTINVTKTANTDLVESVGVEVEETLSKNITDYGGAIVKVIALAAVVAATEDRPCLVAGAPDVIVRIGDRTEDQNSIVLDGNGTPPRKACITLDLEEKPKDATKLVDIPKEKDSSFFTRTYLKIA